MPVSLSYLDSFQTYGRCLVLDNGFVRVVAAAQFGPRILSLSLSGQDAVDGNIFYTDAEEPAIIAHEKITEAFGTSYRLYGGHRLWPSPELYHTSYAPDTDPPSIEERPDGAVITGLVHPSGLQMSIAITLPPDSPQVSVLHTVRNAGDDSISVAPWALSQMAPGGTALVPMRRGEASLLPDRLVILWPYTCVNDARLIWGRDAVLFRQDPGVSESCKFALRNTEGWAAYLWKDLLFFKNFTYAPGSEYPDGGVNFETYTDHRFLELESLGALQTLTPGQSTAHTEQWTLSQMSLSADDPEKALLQAEACRTGGQRA